MRLFILLFSLTLLSYSYGQEVKITGRCIDKNNTPIEFVIIKCKQANDSIVYTNDKGEFEINARQEPIVEIKFKINEFEEIRSIKTSNKITYQIENVKFNYSQFKTVIVSAEKSDPFEIPKLAPIDLQTIPMGSVERSLVYTTAASSNNELTSNYNVRGGNYDENLVYVNGFTINRPFLTRSGQQEGMSFINSALVKDIRFSGGGFDAQYGDKLSSVLDITYKSPDSLKGSAMVSLLGIESHIENKIGSRFDYLVGARYRNNGYLLNALPTKGSYNPIFMDAQFLTNYQLNEKLKWSVIGHFSSNRYRFSPQSSETDFGVANEAYRFKIYFDGQENTYFQTFTGGTSLKWDVSKKTKFDFYASIFNSNEREKYDIQGQYFINQLETDPSKEKYGDSIAVLGIGTFLNHARNDLNATIASIYHNGEHILKKGFKDSLKNNYSNQKIMWGFNFQHDLFKDVLSEWKVIDSAGYNLPHSTNSDEIQLQQSIKSNLNLQTFRATGFLQMNSIWSKIQRNKYISVAKKNTDSTKTKITTIYSDTIKESATRIALNYGLRAGYTQVNNDFYLTPRISLTYFPRIYMVEKGKVVRRDVRYRFSTGLYYQPPIYREFRTYDGKLNTDVKSQKSAHIVAGTDIYFNMWDRESPFKFTAEAYYKYLWDVNLYQIDNVRTMYYANNNATAYAYGLDLNVHGQFIKGVESFFKIGLLNTKERLSTDTYYKYYNKEGELIQPLVNVDQVHYDSVKVDPKYIPRPTDQMLNFGALIQDKMPGYESISVQM